MSAPLTAAQTVVSKYATFKGRATRSEFWWWAVCVIVLLLSARIIDTVILSPLLGSEPSQSNAGRPLSFLISLGLLLPNIALAARRLHDIGKSGWWLLVGLVPILGALVLLYFYVQPSTPETNAYGQHKPFQA